MRHFGRVWIGGIVALSIGATAAAQEQRRAFEIADYFATKFVSAPVISGDGLRVAFSVTSYELESGKGRSELWMIGVDGADLRQMTFGDHHDESPLFSPDGKQLVFVSDRSGETMQLFAMAVDGGEARQLTDFPTGLSDPVYSPNGRWIAATAAVYPECGADAECNKTILTSVSEGPLAAYMADELLYRHWDSWRQGRVNHILLIDTESGAVVRDLTPGVWDSPPEAAGLAGGYAFSPDSSELCFMSNRDTFAATSTNADLFVVKVEPQDIEGTTLNITAANRGWDGEPRYSPDGRMIAFRSQATPGYESDLFRIALFDRARGTVRYLSDSDVYNDWISALAWTPDSSALIFQAEVKGRQPLYCINAKRGAVEPIMTHGALIGWHLSADGKRIVYTHSGVAEPPEVFTVGINGGEPRQLTSFNAQLVAEVDVRPVEEMWVTGDEGTKLQVFIVKPHDFDPERRYPLILNVHGGPQMQWTDRYRGDWQVYPGKGYVVAFPNPTGSSGGGQELTDAISCDWGGQVYRDLMLITDALAELPWVDESRMGAMGWSWGGYMMMWFEGHTRRFKTLASMMGVYDLRSMHGATEELFFVEHDLCGTPWESEHYQRWSPSAEVASFATPCLVITGEQDFRVPYTQSLQFFTDLQRRGVPSRLVVYANAGHWPSWYEMAFYYLVHLDWFHQWLGGDPAPWDPQRFLRNQVFANDE